MSFSVEIPELPKLNSTGSFPKENKDLEDNSPETFEVKNNGIINTNRSEVEEEKEHTHNDLEYGNLEEIQIIEIRHCTICRIDQPIRTKHCRECGKCVATHDHHCPWLGVCVGEKNKKVFYWYLALQLGEILWALI